jgi:hypothetical protein
MADKARPPKKPRYPGGMTLTRQQLLFGHIIADAKKGDLSGLLRSLRSENPSPEVCAFAADIIEGKVKRPKHRPPRMKRAEESMRPALRVLELEAAGCNKRAAAVNQTAKELRICERLVQEWLSQWEPTLESLRRMQSDLEAFRQAEQAVQHRIRRKVRT